MKNNFRVRFLCAVALIIIACVSLPFFNGAPFKIFYAFFSAIAIIELLSFFVKKISGLTVFLTLIELCLIIASNLFIYRATQFQIILLIFGVCGYDVFAYLFGRMFGGKIFVKSRPFPHISKNKTWEGTFMGLITSVALVMILLLVTNHTNYIFLACGAIALVGDLAESALKRTFGIKDSNEIIIKSKPFGFLELLVGGSEGHGGYLDRLDSVAFTTTVLLIVSLFTLL